MTDAVYGRSERGERGRYLSVHVYPGPGTWMLALLIKDAGRPYPRLVRTAYRGPLGDGTDLLPQAARAAAEVLLAQYPAPSPPPA